MKKITYFTLFLSLILVYTSCNQDGLITHDPSSEMVTVAVKDLGEYEDHTRVIAAELPPVEKYELWGTQNGVDRGLLASFSSLTNAVMTLKKGVWNFELKALTTENNVILSGSLTNIELGDVPADLNFTLTPLSEGMGYFELNISWPQSIQPASIIYSINGQQHQITDSVNNSLTISENLETDNYIITVYFMASETDTLTAVSELVQVLPGGKSIKSIPLTEEDFNSAPSAPVSVTAEYIPDSGNPGYGDVLITWEDSSNNETGFVIELPGTSHTVTTGPEITSTIISNISRDDTFINFTVKSINNFGTSDTTQSNGVKLPYVIQTMTQSSNNEYTLHSSKEYFAGEICTLPSLSKEGFTFSGWSSNGWSWITGSFTVTGSRIFYSEWATNDYTVHFDLNGGLIGQMPGASTTLPSITRYYQASIQLHELAPAKTDHFFMGWSTELNRPAQYQPGDNFIIGSSDITLYAVFADSSTYITRWKTDNPGTSGPNQITLPLVSNGNYNFVVDWGDGTRNTITSWNDSNTTHTYNTPGTFTVTISGLISGWAFPSSDHHTNNDMYTPQIRGDSTKLLEIINWGSLAFGNTTGQFQGCSFLQITAQDKPDITGTTDLSYAFAYNHALTTIPNIGTWDVSHIVNMQSMFYVAQNFTADLSLWNTSSVNNMTYLFMRAHSFNSDLSRWNTSKVELMSGMFGHGYEFNSDISQWDTSRVVAMEIMFYDAKKFDQDISGWNVSSLDSWMSKQIFQGSGLSVANHDAIRASWGSISGL